MNSETARITDSLHTHPVPRTTATRPRRRCGAGFILLLLLATGGCRRAERPSHESLADEINHALTSARKDVEELGRAAANLFSEPGSYTKRIQNPPEYKFFQEIMYYTPNDGGMGAVVVTGAVPVGEALIRKVHRLEHLLPRLKSIATKSDFVAMSWLSTPESIALFYPYFDIAAFCPPKLDVTSEILPYVQASSAHNTDRNAVWVEPYIDIVGRGYTVSVSSPVYVAGAMEAVVASDLPLFPLTSRFLDGESDLLMLLTPATYVIGATRSLEAELGLKSMGRLYYLEQITSDVPAPSQFQLATSDSFELRDLARRCVGGESEFQAELNGRSYNVAAAPILETGWRVVRLSRE